MQHGMDLLRYNTYVRILQLLQLRMQYFETFPRGTQISHLDRKKLKHLSKYVTIKNTSIMEKTVIMELRFLCGHLYVCIHMYVSLGLVTYNIIIYYYLAHLTHTKTPPPNANPSNPLNNSSEQYSGEKALIMPNVNPKIATTISVYRVS